MQIYNCNKVQIYKGVRKRILGIRDFTEKHCGTRDLAAPGQRDSPNLGTGCVIAIWKVSEMQDSHKKGAGERDQEHCTVPPTVGDWVRVNTS